MQIIIISTEAQKRELLQSSPVPTANLVWLNDLDNLANYGSAIAVVDLLFENKADRIAALGEVPNRLVIINSVSETLSETNAAFVRIGGWNIILGSTLIEGACLQQDKKKERRRSAGTFWKAGRVAAG